MNGCLISMFVLVTVLSPAPTLAWGDTVHRIICEIAFQELEPTARDRVKAMIRRGPQFDTFAEACTWPDHPRQRETEHYVNVPRDAEGSRRTVPARRGVRRLRDP